MDKQKKKPPYPRAFWILLAGLFINRASASLIWPFLTDYMHESLGIALTLTTLLISVQSISGLVSTAVVSPMMDRVGRKGMMVLGLIASSAVLVVMSFSHAFVVWLVLVAVYGAVNQVYNIGCNAMVADLVEPERRAEGFALLRMVANLGISIGPAVGGFLIAAFTFTFSFHVTAVVNTGVALATLAALPETIPQRQTRDEQKKGGGFRVVFRDRLFITVCGLYVLAMAAPAMTFTLLLIYVKRFGILEAQYGWMVTTNAVMVVLLQYSVTRFAARFRPFPVMALGTFFYALGVGSVGLGTTFLAFWCSMVVLTVGEMLLNPAVMALVANIAPVDRRARYLGVVSVAYPIAAGFAPLIGGILGDTISPQSTWFGGMVIVGMAVSGFYILARKHLFEPQNSPKPSAESVPVVQ